MKPRKLTLNEPHVVAGYTSGLTLRELAAQFGVSSGTIRSTLLRNGVELRNRGRKAKRTAHPEAA